ncbi:MAG: hypothetical protein ACLFP2_04690 [Candidatus Woesearchaeota archaeon]
MPELNFCPFCDAPQHKLALLREDLCFCRVCNTFFSVEQKQFNCFKCNSHCFEDSEFPSPDGQLVLQCRKCKKMFSVDEFFRKNEEE